MIIQGEEPLAIGHRIVDFWIRTADGVVHTQPFVVVRVATCDEFLQEYPGVSPVGLGPRFYEIVSD